MAVIVAHVLVSNTMVVDERAGHMARIPLTYVECLESSLGSLLFNKGDCEL